MSALVTRYFSCLLLLGSFGWPGLIQPVWAEDDNDPPSRVGRISYVDGTVSFRHEHEKDWSDAHLNYPVIAGDQVWTDPDSRMELQFGATEVHMDDATEVDVQKLDDDKTEFYVDQGNVNIHLRSLPNGTVTVLTPRARIDLLRTGSYHVSVDYVDGDDKPPLVKLVTLEGEAHVSIQDDDDDAITGEKVVINGDPASLSVMEGEPTDFDNWALSREHRGVAEHTTRYVSEEVTGYQDLDEDGRWVDDPDYGAVWFPLAVAATWAPYRYGHWQFFATWGWTWIDDAPWGFAPFHYGRWVSINGAWGWCPGARGYHPVFAPALVAFSGHPYGIEHGGPGVGWIPLGPHEVYQPPYHSSVNYVRNININHVTNINTIGVNHFDAPHAPTHFMNAPVLHGGITSVEHHPGPAWNNQGFTHHEVAPHNTPGQPFPGAGQPQQRGNRPGYNPPSAPQGSHGPAPSPPINNRQGIPMDNRPPSPHPMHTFHINNPDFPGHSAPARGFPGHPHPPQVAPLRPTRDGWQRLGQAPSAHMKH